MRPHYLDTYQCQTGGWNEWPERGTHRLVGSPRRRSKSTNPEEIRPPSERSAKQP